MSNAQVFGPIFWDWANGQALEPGQQHPWALGEVSGALVLSASAHPTWDPDFSVSLQVADLSTAYGQDGSGPWLNFFVRNVCISPIYDYRIFFSALGGDPTPWIKRPHQTPSLATPGDTEIRVFAIHDATGNISQFVSWAASPTPVLTTPSGSFMTEIEPPKGLADTFDKNARRSLIVDLAKNHRVEVIHRKAALVRR